MTVLSRPRHPLVDDALALARIWCDGHVIDGSPALGHAVKVARTLDRHLFRPHPELIAAALLHDAPFFAPPDLNLDLVLTTRFRPGVTHTVRALEREHEALDTQVTPSFSTTDRWTLYATTADKIVAINAIVRRASRAADPAEFWRPRTAFVSRMPYFRAFATPCRQFAATAHGSRAERRRHPCRTQHGPAIPDPPPPGGEMTASTLAATSGRTLVAPALFDRLTTRIAAEHPELAADMPARMVDQALAFLGTCAVTTRAIDGDTVAHTDVTPRNLLVSSSVAVVDWAAPCRGAAWIDTAFMVIRLIRAGHSPHTAEAWATAVPAWNTASPAALDTFSAAIADLCEQRRLEHPDPHRGPLAAAARTWAQHRSAAFVG